LAPLAGTWASTLLPSAFECLAVFGFHSASIYSLFICEAFGIEAGIDKSWGEAPAFYWLYTILIIVGAGFILIPTFHSSR